ncbi:MAG: formate dehydrogenase subunit gamma [Gammaproteobacteria bacterium]|nr:formate dehydrogenase subunit gamma [Gammaproteobacteria bacterium]
MTAAEAPKPISQAQKDEILAIVACHKDQPGPLIEILHDVQRSLGYVPAEAVPLIAGALNLSRAEVHGVVSFYHHFRSAPHGRRVLRLCRAEACQSMNGRALERHAMKRLGIGFGETTVDREITLEAVYCLGLCACSPAAMIDEEVHGRVTPERLDELLKRAGAGVRP